MEYKKEAVEKVKKNRIGPIIYVLVFIIFYAVYSSIDVTTGSRLLDILLFIVIAILFAYGLQKVIFMILYKYYS